MIWYSKLANCFYFFFLEVFKVNSCHSRFEIFLYRSVTLAVCYCISPQLFIAFHQRKIIVVFFYSGNSLIIWNYTKRNMRVKYFHFQPSFFISCWEYQLIWDKEQEFSWETTNIHITYLKWKLQLSSKHESNH